MLRVGTQLGISLDSRDFEKVVTVGDLLDAIQAKLAPQIQSGFEALTCSDAA